MTQMTTTFEEMTKSQKRPSANRPANGTEIKERVLPSEPLPAIPDAGPAAAPEPARIELPPPVPAKRRLLKPLAIGVLLLVALGTGITYGWSYWQWAAVHE